MISSFASAHVWLTRIAKCSALVAYGGNGREGSVSFSSQFMIYREL